MQLLLCPAVLLWLWLLRVTDLYGCHCGLWASLKHPADAVIDLVVNAATSRLVLELVDVESCAEVAPRAGDHNGLDC